MKKLRFNLGTPAYDHLLHLKPLATATCSDAEVRTVFGAFNLAALQRLDGAFRRGQVVRRIFTAGDGKGCLLYHLDHSIVSFGAQRGLFAYHPIDFDASQRLLVAM